MIDEGHQTSPERVSPTVIVAAATGAAVSVAVGVYGQVHDPTGSQTISLFFSSTLAFKSWVTTGVVLLALFQAFTAMRMFGKISFPRNVPTWMGQTHRLSGTIILIATLPVAYHCLWALGFEPDISEPRRFVHSLLGSAFYGAFVTKVIAVRSKSVPSWFLPTMGGLVFSLLLGLWLTSSLWYFTNVEFPGF